MELVHYTHREAWREAVFEEDPYYHILLVEPRSAEAPGGPCIGYTYFHEQTYYTAMEDSENVREAVDEEEADAPPRPQRTDVCTVSIHPVVWVQHHENYEVLCESPGLAANLEAVWTELLVAFLKHPDAPGALNDWVATVAPRCPQTPPAK